MSFKHKPGRFSLFVNDRKEEDRDPDYTGTLMLEDGTECWLGAWKETTNKGTTYLSGRYKPKDQQRQSGGTEAQDPAEHHESGPAPF